MIAERVTVHRLNTYPVVHTGIIQALFSLIAIIPLMERFEAEHGTLTSIALFGGRTCYKKVTVCARRKCSRMTIAFSTFPGFLYILVEHVLFRANYAIAGAR